MVTGITSNQVSLCFLLDLTLSTGAVLHVWTGYGSITWNGNTYLGVGDLGQVGDVTEGSDVKANGTTIALSGIDPTLLSDALNDIQQSAPATLWLATFSAGAITAAYALYAGTVDKPGIQLGVDTATITIALENKLANLQRATNRRYTQADQRYYYPTDIGFAWVETQNDIALIWG